MFLEALVLSSCIGGYECNVTPRAYYLTKPHLRSWVKKTSKDVKEYSQTIPYGDIMMPTIAGFLFLSRGGRVTMRINEHISIRVRNDATELRFTYAF